MDTSNHRRTPPLHRCVSLLGLLVVACLDPNAAGNLVPTTVDENSELPRIEVAGTVLHAETFGNPDHPMIIALHGGPGADYGSILPLQALADDGYYVVFWDQRGTGLSRRHDADSYTLEQYIGDLRAVVDHYLGERDRPYVFIGHSWGAMYATWFINEHGDDQGRLAGAVLSEPGAFNRPQLEDFFERFFAEYDFVGESLNDIVWSSQFMTSEGHERADFLLAQSSAPATPAYHIESDNPPPMWRLGAVVNSKLSEVALDTDFDWTTNLSDYPTKVLFLRGDLNTLHTEAHQRELAASYPSSEIVTLEGVGHEMIWEQPDAYLVAVRDYFREIGFAGGNQ